MSWIVQNIPWILIVSGLATFGIFPMIFAPRWGLKTLFGEDVAAPPAILVARSWASMIAASGLMLVYAAWHPEVRLPVLLFSIVGKTGFVLLTLSDFPRTRKQFALPVAIGDGIIVLLLAWYLLASR